MDNIEIWVYAHDMWEKAKALSVSSEQTRVLESWVRAYNTPQGVVRRCQIVLKAAEGTSNNHIAKELRLSRSTVLLWRERFATGGCVSLLRIKKGRGRRQRIPVDKVQRIVEATLHTTPAGATHWSTRVMAKAQGVSNATIHRIWNAHGLQPHRVKTFKLSRDQNFVQKLTDVVGLYLEPPDKALVLCVDEKTQVQALDRTQPGLPMKKGRCGTMTHDCKRNGTTCLFAALNMLDGTVVGSCYARHRHEEFLKFLRTLDRKSNKDMVLHLILDNYGTHSHPNVKKWLVMHPRFHLHFTPTSSSWLNLIERWFAELTNKRIRRGVFHNVSQLIQSIYEFLDEYNKPPKPFIWTASVQSIMEKVNHCKAIYDTLH